jgi:hypothetical protein
MTHISSEQDTQISIKKYVAVPMPLLRLLHFRRTIAGVEIRSACLPLHSFIRGREIAQPQLFVYAHIKAQEL